MRKLFFKNILLSGGWADNVQLIIDNNGIISDIITDAKTPETGFDGYAAVAGMANLHSHAFQRAMSGLGEWAGETANDSFWTWRDVMYRFVEKITPDDLHAIAAQSYVEMLESGFTAVGEFHYLHHQVNGSPYDNLAEMSLQLMNAAETVGVAQTLLPVFYAQGGFGAIAVKDAQLRFYNDEDRFLELVKECRGKVSERNVVGIAPHSLRAVTPDSLNNVVTANNDCPIHIHIAEQIKEVEDCVEWSGERPVKWLFDNQKINDKWCLVHATHLDSEEIDKLASSGAVAGLCPITEANLGDGIFEGVQYMQWNGAWGIGSDSNVKIDMAEELRLYEYSQRLRDKGRNRIAQPSKANGRTLFDSALVGGAKALGQQTGTIEVGKYADIVSLNLNNPALIARKGDDLINSWVFSGDRSCVSDVWVSGNHVVKDGYHKKRSEVLQRFTEILNKLNSN